MTKFHKLPNDPQMLSLNQEQIDFMLLSMERDGQEAVAAAKGNALDADIVDANYDKIDQAERDEDWDVMEPGQDPDKIFDEVKKLTQAVDPSYEEQANQRLKIEEAKVDDRLRNKQDIIKEQQAYVEKVKQRAMKMKPKDTSHSKVIKDTHEDIDDNKFLNL